VHRFLARFGFSRRQRFSTRHLFQITDDHRTAALSLRNILFPRIHAMNTGTVKFYNGNKGFGFIEPADGSKDIFVHVSALERAGLEGLAEGQKLQFDLEQDTKGRSSAANLQLI
jgi:CspA family cold shock protein